MSSSTSDNKVNESLNNDKTEADGMIKVTPLDVRKKKIMANNRKSNTNLSINEVEEYNRLLSMEKELDAELAKLKNELETGAPIQDTMDNLHEYNDIKDATQVVLGAMANMHGVTIASLHREYDVPLNEKD